MTSTAVLLTEINNWQKEVQLVIHWETKQEKLEYTLLTFIGCIGVSGKLIGGLSSQSKPRSFEVKCWNAL